MDPASAAGRGSGPVLGQGAAERASLRPHRFRVGVPVGNNPGLAEYLSPEYVSAGVHVRHPRRVLPPVCLHHAQDLVQVVIDLHAHAVDDFQPGEQPLGGQLLLRQIHLVLPHVLRRERRRPAQGEELIVIGHHHLQQGRFPGPALLGLLPVALNEAGVELLQPLLPLLPGVQHIRDAQIVPVRRRAQLAQAVGHRLFQFPFLLLRREEMHLQPVQLLLNLLDYRPDKHGSLTV